MSDDFDIRDRFVVYNPRNVNPETLPIIYGLNNTGDSPYTDCIGILVSEDGHPLGSHFSSQEGYLYGDLGILEGRRPDRHETFRMHYPDGYRMDLIRYNEFPARGIDVAVKLMEARNEDTHNTG